MFSLFAMEKLCCIGLYHDVIHNGVAVIKIDKPHTLFNMFLCVVAGFKKRAISPQKGSNRMETPLIKSDV